MEVMIPSPARDFNFDSASTTPFLSATSSPQRSTSSSAAFFYSAPTSPTRISTFYGGGGDSHLSTPSAVPFLWEEKPGTPKSHLSTAASSTYGDADQDLDDADFAFDFTGHLDRHSLPADELFHRGQIKPLKPPPRFHYAADSSPSPSPKSPRKFSPRHRSKPDVDPFAAAIEETRKETDRRGRERTTTNTTTNPHSSRERNKGSSRSLSPFRVSDLLFDQDEETQDETKNNNNNNNNNTTSSFASFWYKKWKIKDLLLFRSASESRAKDKQKLYSHHQHQQLKKGRNDDVKNSSFRSTDSVGSVSSRRRSGPPISAHELHYTMNRAFSEEMRRRTSLPYKQGLLGCLGFNPTVPEIPKGSLPRGSEYRNI